MPGIRVVTLEGSPLERGRAYGEELRELIHGAFEVWRESLARAVGANVDAYIDEFMARCDFQPAIERATPGLLDEVRGLADGAGIDPRLMYAYQLVDEEWVYRRQRTSPQLAERCSALGTYGETATPIVAQNLDLPSDFDGFQCLLRLRDQQGESLLVAYAGMIVLNGLNDRGVGVCANTVNELRASTNGLPVAFVMRGLLQQSSLADAQRFAGSVRHASGQNFIIGAADGVADIECSADRVVRYGSGSRVGHTNHPLVNDDRWEVVGEGQVAGIDGSKRRLAYLQGELDTDSRPIDVARAKELLTNPALCRVAEKKGSAISLASTVMEVGAHPVLHVSAGPPAQVAYERFAFDA